MKYCKECQVSVRDNWQACPLCDTEFVISTEIEQLVGKGKTPSAFLNPSLRFDRTKVTKSFISWSLVLILFYLAVRLFLPFKFFGLEFILLGLMTTWLMIVILLRKRRNIVKSIMYLLVLFSAASLYMDYTNAEIGWSITFVIPILCISAILAMFISVRFVDLKVGDYVLYLQLAAIVGIIPLVFVLMDWVGHPLPSILSTVFSFIMFIYVFIKHRQKITEELSKRMHL